MSILLFFDKLLVFPPPLLRAKLIVHKNNVSQFTVVVAFFYFEMQTKIVNFMQPTIRFFVLFFITKRKIIITVLSRIPESNFSG